MIHFSLSRCLSWISVVTASWTPVLKKWKPGSKDGSSGEIELFVSNKWNSPYFFRTLMVSYFQKFNLPRTLPSFQVLQRKVCNQLSLLLGYSSTDASETNCFLSKTIVEGIWLRFLVKFINVILFVDFIFCMLMVSWEQMGPFQKFCVKTVACNYSWMANRFFRRNICLQLWNLTF